MSYGEAITPLPGDLPPDSNPFEQYIPSTAVAWLGPDGDVWKVDPPAYPLGYAIKGTWISRVFAGLARNTVMAIQQIQEKPGLDTVPITSDAVNFDVAYPVSNFGPWLYEPVRSTVTG